MVNKIGSRNMALYYTLTWRGTIGSLNWASSIHFRQSEGDPLTELELCKNLAEMGADKWETLVKPITSGNVTMNKSVAIAYEEPTGFFEQPTALVGDLVGQICPQFVAMGFRQLRSNADFRAATHRLPGVRELNNVDGSWVYTDPELTAAMVADVEALYANPSDFTDSDSNLVQWTPVLVRTQFTTGSAENPPIVVTFLNPHEISDVAGAQFYGITSQVSRKFIISG
jgi:hypothetical protein